jgi:hypothetical protein
MNKKLTASIAAVALAAAGFYGGVEVQKHQGATSSSGAGGMRASAGGPPSGGGAPSSSTSATSNATTGTVKSTRDGVIYLETSDGTTIKVKTTATSRVTRNARTTAGQVHPGDSVVVQGTTGANGTVTATQVSASSAANAS